MNGELEIHQDEQAKYHWRFKVDGHCLAICSDRYCSESDAVRCANMVLLPGWHPSGVRIDSQATEFPRLNCYLGYRQRRYWWRRLLNWCQRGLNWFRRHR